jgi:AcrR family transcriptional regulator
MPRVEASAEGRPPPPSSRSRRRGPSKGDLKEQAILETAERLLREKSIHEIGVDELAKGAGISRPTFYFYFESKFAVLQALVDRVVHESYDVASRWLTRDDEIPERAIRHTLEAIAAQWREHGPIMRAAVETWGAVPEMGRYWEAITAGFVEAAAGKIRRERRSGVAPDGPEAKSLATALIWMNERCFYTAAAGASPSLAPDELVDTLTTVWLRSVYGSDRPSAESVERPTREAA